MALSRRGFLVRIGATLVAGVLGANAKELVKDLPVVSEETLVPHNLQSIESYSRSVMGSRQLTQQLLSSKHMVSDFDGDTMVLRGSKDYSLDSISKREILLSKRSIKQREMMHAFDKGHEMTYTYAKKSLDSINVELRSLKLST